jgi:small subunit ribosomal protein S3
VVEDRKIRDYVKKKLEAAGISHIEIERFGSKVKLRIHTARPGIVIGKKGADIENLRRELEKLLSGFNKAQNRGPLRASAKSPSDSPAEGLEKVAEKDRRFSADREVMIDIQEVRKPEISAQLVAENVAQQLQKRVTFRRAMKKSISLAFKFGALGVKIHCAGRLGGAEMARREWYREGRVPLQTLRADVDYGFAEAKTTYGIIGVKVHIFKGEIISNEAAEKL